MDAGTQDPRRPAPSMLRLPEAVSSLLLHALCKLPSELSSLEIVLEGGVQLRFPRAAPSRRGISL